MKKVIFGLIATLLFVSCENETTNSESNYSKSNTLEQNLNEFSKNRRQPLSPITPVLAAKSAQGSICATLKTLIAFFVYNSIIAPE
mgnify:CR=1 FL=1